MEPDLPSQLIGMTDVLDSTGWTNLNNTVTNMNPDGTTQSGDRPCLGMDADDARFADRRSGRASANTQQVIILVSDGLKYPRPLVGHGGNEDSVTDARMALTCTNAKARGHHDLHRFRRSQWCERAIRR